MRPFSRLSQILRKPYSPLIRVLVWCNTTHSHASTNKITPYEQQKRQIYVHYSKGRLPDLIPTSIQRLLLDTKKASKALNTASTDIILPHRRPR